MGKKQKFITFSVLFGAVLLFALGLPFLLNNDEGFAQPAIVEFTPQSTSAGARPASAEIKGVIENEVYVSSEEKNCTYPVYYWLEMPEKWPSEVVLSRQVYTRETLRELYMIAEPDQHTRLIQQMYTSFLNVLYGADIISIEDTLFNAAEWLEHNPPGSDLSEFNLRQGRDMTQVLEYFNNGEIGPGACPDAPPPPLPTLIPTEETTLTPTDLRLPAAPQVRVIPPPTSMPPASEEPAPPPPPPPAPTNNPLPPSPTDPALPPSPTGPAPTDTPLPAPTSTPLPPPTQTPEEPEKKHPQGEALSDKYGVPYAEIMGWHDQGVGFGDIDKAYELAQETGTAVSTIFAMLASGMSWGEIREALNP
jgi:hypothetical protein